MIVAEDGVQEHFLLCRALFQMLRVSCTLHMCPLTRIAQDPSPNQVSVLITCERVTVPVLHEITMIVENGEENKEGETEAESLESRIHVKIGTITLLLFC